MELRTTTKITKINIGLYVYFAVANLLEAAMGIWEEYLFRTPVFGSMMRNYMLMATIYRIELSFHQLINLVSLVFSIIWLYRVYRLMRTVDSNFKANKVLVFIFWLIPLYSLFYIFVAHRKIIRVAKNQKQLVRKMRWLNTFLLLSGSVAVIILVGNFVNVLFFRMINVDPRPITIVGSVCSFVYSVAFAVFFQYYLTLEQKLILAFNSNPELNETDLIDG